MWILHEAQGHTKCLHCVAQPIFCTQAECAENGQFDMHDVSAAQPVRKLCQLEQISCHHATGEVSSSRQTQRLCHSEPLASALASPKIPSLFPAGAAHATPDSQPSEEDPGRHGQNGKLPLQQNGVCKQQKPLALLRAAGAKRALDRDEAGSEAKSAKQTRAGNACPCRSEHTVARLGPLVPLAM